MANSPCKAVYWHFGERIEEEFPNRDAAAERLWDRFCDAEGSPIAVTDINGRAVMDAAALDADRLERMRTQRA